MDNNNNNDFNPNYNNNNGGGGGDPNQGQQLYPHPYDAPDQYHPPYPPLVEEDPSYPSAGQPQLPYDMDNGNGANNNNNNAPLLNHETAFPRQALEDEVAQAQKEYHERIKKVAEQTAKQAQNDYYHQTATIAQHQKRLTEELDRVQAQEAQARDRHQERLRVWEQEAAKLEDDLQEKRRQAEAQLQRLQHDKRILDQEQADRQKQAQELYQRAAGHPLPIGTGPNHRPAPLEPFPATAGGVPRGSAVPAAAQPRASSNNAVKPLTSSGFQNGQLYFSEEDIKKAHYLESHTTLSRSYHDFPWFQWFCESKLELTPMQVDRMLIRDLCTALMKRNIVVPLFVVYLFPRGRPSWEHAYPEVWDLIVAQQQQQSQPQHRPTHSHAVKPATAGAMRTVVPRPETRTHYGTTYPVTTAKSAVPRQSTANSSTAATSTARDLLSNPAYQNPSLRNRIQSHLKASHSRQQQQHAPQSQPRRVVHKKKHAAAPVPRQAVATAAPAVRRRIVPAPAAAEEYEYEDVVEEDGEGDEEEEYEEEDGEGEDDEGDEGDEGEDEEDDGFLVGDEEEVETAPVPQKKRVVRVVRTGAAAAATTAVAAPRRVVASSTRAPVKVVRPRAQ